ncbi:hypothetical protein ACFY5H_35080 [Streptomyces sp. NPDC013012]|uniref:hypothetical protein n=1 Tax=Streptomyces sp. NPDC013012 TaxID=3364860 RepID=UPI0036B605F1
MGAGWTLGLGLASRVAAIPGPRLATPAEHLRACVYPLRESDGTWTFRLLPSWPTAIYVALDRNHGCLYTGIVQRGTAEHPDMNAVRDRTREHYRDNQPPEARHTWHHLWVIPLEHNTPRANLETWETRVRRQTASTQTRKSSLLRPT